MKTGLLIKNKILLLAIAFCVPSIFFILNPAKFPADDGFFYPQIAYNIVKGYGSRFNDLYLTNGYHPLWMIFCVTAEYFNFFAKRDVVFILWLFQVILCAAGFYILAKKFLAENFAGLVAALSFLSVVFFSLGTLMLTEAHLNFLSLVVMLWFLTKKNQNDFLFGVLCAIAFLARLDNIFIVAVMGFYNWQKNTFSPLKLARWIAAFFVVVGPYLLYNYLIFSDIIPISGKIKSTFPSPKSSFSISYLQLLFLISNASFLLFLLFRHTPDRGLKIYFTAGALLLLLYNLFFQGQVGQWYFIAQIIVTSLIVYESVATIEIAQARSKVFIIVFTSLLLAGPIVVGFVKLTTNLSVAGNIMDERSAVHKSDKDLVQALAEDLKNQLPAGTRILTYDFPGKLAFFSDLNVIPADGLVANRTYFNELKALSFKEYLRKNKIVYLILPNSINSKEKKVSLIALDLMEDRKSTSYNIKSSLDKKIVDSISAEDLKQIKLYKNPLNTWQKEYDSIGLYRFVY